MKELIKLIAEKLVDNPEEVSVSEIRMYGTTVLELTVDKPDMGKIIGRGGRNAVAIRKILNAAAAKERNRYILDVVEKAPSGSSTASPDTLHNVGTEMCSGRQTGIVTWFHNEKRYGFITMDDGAEIFVHCSSVKGFESRSLNEGSRVAFDIAQRPKGFVAVNVVKI